MPPYMRPPTALRQLIRIFSVVLCVMTLPLVRFAGVPRDSKVYAQTSESDAFQRKINQAYRQCRLGECAIASERLASACEGYTDELELFRSCIAHAQALFEMADSPERSLELAYIAQRRFPEDAGLMNNLGSTLMQMGRQSEALEWFRKSLVAQPDYFFGHYNTGYVLSDRGDFNAALEHYGAAFRIHPYHLRLQQEAAHAFVHLPVSDVQLDGRLDAWFARTAESVERNDFQLFEQVVRNTRAYLQKSNSGNDAQAERNDTGGRLTRGRNAGERSILLFSTAEPLHQDADAIVKLMQATQVVIESERGAVRYLGCLDALSIAEITAREPNHEYMLAHITYRPGANQQLNRGDWPIRLILSTFQEGRLAPVRPFEFATIYNAPEPDRNAAARLDTPEMRARLRRYFRELESASQ